MASHKGGCAIIRFAAVSPLALTVALAAAHGAAAQASNSDGASARSTNLEEVIVTARKVAENLQDVPVSVSALSGKQLTQNNSVHLTDLAASVPGFSARPATSPIDAPSFEIRGQNQTNALATVDAAVGVYVDGVYWAREYGINSDLLDAKDAQVLRGPQGTLFGRNTTGGAVLLETNDPNLTKFGGELSASYGNYNYAQGRAIVNIPLINDTLAARIAVQRTYQDGYQPLRFDPSTKDGSTNNLSARAKILWKPRDGTSVLLSANYYWANFNLPAFNLAYFPSTSPAFEAGAYEILEAGNSVDHLGFFGCSGVLGATPASAACQATGASLLQSDINKYLHSDTADSHIPNHQREQTQTYGLTLTQDTPIGQAKLIAGYRRIDTKNINNYPGSEFTLGYFNVFDDLYQWSLEGQLTGNAADNKFHYATGVFVFNESGNDGTYFAAFPSLQPIFPAIVQYLGHIDNKSLGVYGQATYDFTDKFSVTEGLRWSQESKGVTTENGSWTGGTIDAVAGSFSCKTAPPDTIGCGTNLTAKASNWSYLLDLDYKLTPHVMFYAKTARGYRSGGVNLRATVIPGANGANFDPNVFKPEQSTEYEVGMKSQFWDNRIRFNVDAFYTFIKNIQRTTIYTCPTCQAATTFESNAGEADVDGFEAELDVKAWQTADQSFTVNVAASNSNPFYKSYKNAVNGFDQSHENFDSVIKTEVDVGGTYVHNFDLGDLTLHAIYSWEGGYPMYVYNYYLSGGVPLDASTGEQLSPADAQGLKNALKSPPSGVLNLRASFAFDQSKYELAVWGNNVLNNRDFISDAAITSWYVSEMRREPVMFGVTATAHF